MTRDKARKREVRERMAATREPYTEAARHVGRRDAEPFAGAVIKVEMAFFRGPDWGGGLHSHITEYAVTGRSADLTPLTLAEAQSDLERQARGATEAELEALLRLAYPGVRVELIYSGDGDEDDPYLFYRDPDDDGQDVDDEADESRDNADPALLLHYELTRDCMAGCE